MPREAQKTLQSKAHKQNVHVNFAAVLRSRKYFFRLRLRGAIKFELRLRLRLQPYKKMFVAFGLLFIITESFLWVP
jgi:hypothetical protein